MGFYYHGLAVWYRFEIDCRRGSTTLVLRVRFLYCIPCGYFLHYVLEKYFFEEVITTSCLTRIKIIMNKTISVVAPNQSLLAFFDYFRNWKAQFHLLRLWLSHRVPFWRSTTNDPRGQDNRNEPQYEADASERNAGVDDIAVASRSFMMNDSSFPIIAPTFYEWQVVEISKRPQKSNRVQHYIGYSHTFSSVLRAATLASHDGRTDQRQNR